MDKNTVICRCQEITYGEVLEAIREGAVTVAGVKKRVGSGMGLCQGKYCEKLVAHIISEETGLPLDKILPDTKELALPSEEETKAVQAAKLEQFQNIMTQIMAEALARNNSALSQEVSSQVGDKLVKEMNYVLREREEAEEERFKRLDESLRAMQQKNKARAEAAASKAPVVKLKKKRFSFGKKAPKHEPPV